LMDDAGMALLDSEKMGAAYAARASRR